MNITPAILVVQEGLATCAFGKPGCNLMLNTNICILLFAATAEISFNAKI
jgi:hypothetical protein